MQEASQEDKEGVAAGADAVQPGLHSALEEGSQGSLAECRGQKANLEQQVASLTATKARLVVADEEWEETLDLLYMEQHYKQVQSQVCLCGVQVLSGVEKEQLKRKTVAGEPSQPYLPPSIFREPTC